MVKKGTWVEITFNALEAGQRSASVPLDTQQVPLQVKARGFLCDDAKLGEVAKIETVIGRKLEGKLIDVNPTYKHNFGEIVPEVLTIGRELRQYLSIERG